jgi:thioredoxin reductase (NADPH)
MTVGIIGSGPASLTAAIYLCLAGHRVHVFTGYNMGGLLTTTELVDNYPGSYNIKGKELAYGIYDHFKKVAADNNIISEEDVISVVFKGNKKVIETLSGTYEFDYVIVGTGSNPRKLGVAGEELIGISYCAICDGNFYKNKVVMVIGGGETALQDTIYLSNIAKKVYLVHRRNTFRSHTDGNVKKVEELAKSGKVEIILNTTVEKFVGREGLQEVYLSNGLKYGIDGAFIAIGHLPNSAFIKGHEVSDISNSEGIEKDGDYILVDSNYETNVPGFFAVGDVIKFKDGCIRYNQAVIAAAEGCKAALYLIEKINSINN